MKRAKRYEKMKQKHETAPTLKTAIIKKFYGVRKVALGLNYRLMGVGK